MIVLQQDIWWCRLLLSLVDHRVRYGFVDGNVAAFPGLVNSPADVGRSRRVPHEMLHEPQQRIAEDVIVALVCRLWDGHEAHIDFVVRHLEERAAFHYGAKPDTDRHGRGDPGGRAATG